MSLLDRWALPFPGTGITAVPCIHYPRQHCRFDMSGATQHLAPEAFLSHCSSHSSQRDFVLYLGDRLKDRGLQYFSSAEQSQGCPTGASFSESLLQHVRDAKVVVLVLSQQFFSRKWCMQELAAAVEVQQQHPGKILLPVFTVFSRQSTLGTGCNSRSSSPCMTSVLSGLASTCSSSGVAYLAYRGWCSGPAAVRQSLQSKSLDMCCLTYAAQSSQSMSLWVLRSGLTGPSTT